MPAFALPIALALSIAACSSSTPTSIPTLAPTPSPSATPAPSSSPGTRQSIAPSINPTGSPALATPTFAESPAVPASRHPYGPGTWTTGTKLPSQRAETTAITLDGKIYLPGGLDRTRIGPGGVIRSLASMVVYDPATDTYTNAADMPDPDGRDHIGIATWGGKIYVSGGGLFGAPAVRDNLWMYDPATNAWTTLAPMPAARWQHAMVAIRGVLYVLGGVVKDRRDATPMWAYDIAAGTWRTGLAPLPTQRDHLSGIAADGKILAVGGRDIANLPTVEIYDPRTNVWTPGPPMPTARGGMTSGLIEGVIHATGGENLDSNSTYPQHEGLDLATMTWQTYADLPNKRHGLMSGVVDVRWYVMGGGRAAGLSTSDLVDVWQP